jgi:hypothetical protein
MESNVGSFFDVNALKSVENIKRVIAQYREEQETLMKKMSLDTSRPSQIREQTLDRICDYCCLISVGRKSPEQMGSWPVTLVGSLANKSLGLGSFESNGSLWRFVKTDDSHGLRVVIECAVSNIMIGHYYVVKEVAYVQEIGEKVLYLTNNLELSENNSTINISSHID